MKSILILLCAAGMLAFSPQSNASTLFGATASGSVGRLYTIDSATGAMISDIGLLNDGSAVNYPITGLAFHPTTGVLYGSTGNNPSGTAGRFVTINPATALVTVIGLFNAGPVNGSGTPATMTDLAFDAAGNLYGVGSIGGPQLYSIDIATGQATVIGGTGLTSTTGGGLAINAGVAYGTPTASRYGTYDLITGAYSNITNPVKPGGGGAFAALTFDENGVLYALNSAPGSPPPTFLATIDPTTGTVTSLGQSIDSLDAIAFQPVPEPTTMVLFMGSAAVLVVVGARRRK